MPSAAEAPTELEQPLQQPSDPLQQPSERVTPTSRGTAQRYAVTLERSALRAGQSLWFTLRSASMWPKLRPGDRLCVEHVALDALRAGDIVVYQRDERLIAHRLLHTPGAQARTLHCRADALARADPPIDVHLLAGLVTAVDRGGRITKLAPPGPWMRAAWLPLCRCVAPRLLRLRRLASALLRAEPP